MSLSRDTSIPKYLQKNSISDVEAHLGEYNEHLSFKVLQIFLNTSYVHNFGFIWTEPQAGDLAFFSQ